MNTSSPADAPIQAMSSSTNLTGSAFWERLWRLSGINFIACLVIAYVVYGTHPGVGASGDALVAFYTGDRTRVLVAVVLGGMAILNLLWFAAALRATLADAGRDGWGAAATTSSAIVGGLFLVLITVVAAFAYSVGPESNQLAPELNHFAWACAVLTSFPRAMLIMSGTFGLWRARLISNQLFAGGVAIVVLVLLGGTTWLSGGFWAPDGVYSRFVSPILGLVWIVVVSRVLLTRSPATRAAW